jgi:WD40 repeat protein
MLKEFGLGEIGAVAWSPDGKNLAIGGYPRVYIFGQGDTRPKVSLPADGRVNQLDFSPNGKLLAGQSGLSIQVWDISTGHSLYTLKNLENPGCWYTSISFSSDEQVVSAQCGKVTYRWKALTGEFLDKTEASQPEGMVSPDRKWLVQTDDNTIQLVEASTGKIVQSTGLSGMTPVVRGFSPDGKTFLVWFYRYEIAPSGIYYPGQNPESVIQLWDLRSATTPSLRASLPAGEWHRWEGDFLQGFQAFDFTPDGNRLLTASGDGNLRIWDLQTSKLLYKLPGGAKNVYISPDRRQVAAIGGKVQIWNIAPGKQPSLAWDIPGFSDFRSLLALSNNGSNWVTTSGQEFRIWHWDGATLAERPSIITAPDADATHQAISPDGKWLAYSAKTGIVLGENNAVSPNWRSLEKYPEKSFSQGTLAIAFSPESSHLAVVDTNRNTLLWNLGKLNEQPLELVKETYISDLVFSPDGNLLLGSDGGTDRESNLYLWEVTTGTLLRTWKTKGYQFAFHPNGTVLAAADYSSGQIFLYDLRTWQPMQSMKGPQYVSAVAFSPDGSLLVTSADNTTNIWDASNGKLLKSLPGFFPPLFFSPDGTTLITGLGNGRIQVFGLPAK